MSTPRSRITVEQKRMLAAILCTKRQDGKHLTAKRLCEMIDCKSDATGEQVRAIIRDWGLHGIPGYPEYEICSNNNGFWATNDTKEIERYRESLRRRSVSMFVRSRAMWTRQKNRMNGMIL